MGPRRLLVMLAILGPGLLASAGAGDDVKRLDAACQAGDPKACRELAVELLLVDDDPGAGKARVRALERACTLADGEACWDPGLEYLRGGAVAVDRPRGQSLLERGCELRNADCCYALGESHDLGDLLPRDPARALRYFTRGCDLGNAESCYRLGLAAVAAEPPEHRRAAGLFDQACERDVLAACVRLAVMYQRGLGVGRDASRGASLLARGCRGMSADECDLMRGFAEADLRVR